MIATQASLGDVGKKPTTEISLSFDSLVVAEGFSYGLNKDGIHILGDGETDSGAQFTREFTLATTDLGDKRPKRLRFIYLGIDSDSDITVSVSMDGQPWKSYNASMKKSGIQRVKVPIGTKVKGKYTTIKLSSNGPFRVDTIFGKIIMLSAGNGGY